MGMHKQMREYRAMLAEFGIVIEDERHSKHVVTRGTYRGRVVTITLPLSPSDRRHMLNFRAQLRRALAKIDAVLDNCP